MRGTAYRRGGRCAARLKSNRDTRKRCRGSSRAAECTCLIESSEFGSATAYARSRRTPPHSASLARSRPPFSPILLRRNSCNPVCRTAAFSVFSQRTIENLPPRLAHREIFPSLLLLISRFTLTPLARSVAVCSTASMFRPSSSVSRDSRT